MLDTSAVIVLFIGALFIAGLGAVANYATQTEGNKITAKTLARDFVIGLGLSGAAYFFVPESFQTLGSALKDATDAASSAVTTTQDVELHVGPLPF